MSRLSLIPVASGITSGATTQLMVTEDRRLLVVDEVGVIFDSAQAGELMTADFDITGSGVTSGITTDYRVVIGSTVQFNDLTTNSPTQWYWDFGDGDTSITQNPTHVYTTISTGITVSLLTAKVGAGNYISKTNYIEVYSSIDPDAQAFFTAAGITDPTQQSAINLMVVQMKANNLWTKMYAIYPFVGGTASTHKFNLKDPQNTNAAYRLTFSGSFTHNATGAISGANGYANTYFNPIAAGASLSSHSMSVYSPNIFTGVNSMIGSQSDLGGADLNTITPVNGFMRGWIAGALTPDMLGNVSTTGLNGLHTISTNGSRLGKYYSDGARVGLTATQSAPSFPNLSYYLFDRNRNNSPIDPMVGTLSYASIGTGLSDTDVANLYTIIQTYQTTLGRQV